MPELLWGNIIKPKLFIVWQRNHHLGYIIHVILETVNNNLLIFWENNVGGIIMSEEKKGEVFKFADEYIDYLNSSKTEKEIVKNGRCLD